MSGFKIIQQNPNFFRVWIGQLLSQSGNRMAQIAIVWWFLETVIEGSGRWIGLFMVVSALPSLLFLRLIGHYIDKHASKRILVSADMIAAILLISVSVLLHTHHYSLPIALFIGFLSATCQAFIDPTLNRSVNQIVNPEDLETGIAFLTSTQSISNFTGAVFGAALIGHLGISGTVLLAGVGYVFSSTLTALASFRPLTTAESMQSGNKGILEILKEFPFVKKLLLGFGLVNFFGTPTLVVLPIYVKKVLQGTASTLGVVEASLWVGLIAGAYLSGKILKELSPLRNGIFSLLLFGVMLVIPSLFLDLKVYCVSLFLAGAALGMMNVRFVSMFQRLLPDEVKGRFFALMQGYIGFTFPIAYFAFGLLCDSIEPHFVPAIQGCGVLVVTLWFVGLLKEEPT